MTNFYNVDSLLDELDRKINYATADIVKFQTQLDKNPMHAFEWSANETIKRAVEHGVYSAVKVTVNDLISKGETELQIICANVAEILVDSYTRHAKWPSRSTSAMDNEVALVKTSVEVEAAEFLKSFAANARAEAERVAAAQYLLAVMDTELKGFCSQNGLPTLDVAELLARKLKREERVWLKDYAKRLEAAQKDAR